MLRRHVDQLMTRLDELYIEGVTYISWGEVYHWYGIERITKKIWGDIDERWETLLEEKDEDYVAVQVAEVREGVTLVAKKLKKLRERSL